MRMMITIMTSNVDALAAVTVPASYAIVIVAKAQKKIKQTKPCRSRGI